jgi:hypothetical protein
MVDSNRQAYERWGLGPATLRSKLSPGLYWATLKAVIAVVTGRERALKEEPGPRQLGGDFVVNHAGLLVFEHRMKSFHDRASIDELVAAMRLEN